MFDAYPTARLPDHWQVSPSENLVNENCINDSMSTYLLDISTAQLIRIVIPNLS